MFSDASYEVYGVAAYIRLDNENAIHTSLLMSKSRVAPLKPTTILRMELTAATVNIKGV